MTTPCCKPTRTTAFPFGGKSYRPWFVIFLFAARFAVVHAEPYTFTTLAGRAGVYGSGDGTNANAQFTSPEAIALDSSGALYIADNVDNVIRKVTPQGTNWVVTTLAGSAGVTGSGDGTNASAQFNQPSGIAVDSGGSIFVADTANHIIRRMFRTGHPSTNWAVVTIAGLAGVPGATDGTNSNAQFNSPTGLGVDGADNLYVGDYANNTVRKVTPVGTNWVVSTLAGLAGTNNFGTVDGTNSSARFHGPAGVALDGANNLFVADNLNHTIRRINPSGTNWVVTTLAGLAGNSGSADGTNTNARFDYPVGVAVDGATNFYVADSSNNSIRKGTLAGTNWLVSTTGGVAGLANYGSADGLGGAARFWNPQGIASDKSGNVYIADTWNATVRGGKQAIALQITLSSGQLRLSWPLQATNYNLETSGSLASNPTWQAITSGIVSNSLGFMFTTNASTPRSFFRLHQ